MVEALDAGSACWTPETTAPERAGQPAAGAVPARRSHRQRRWWLAEPTAAAGAVAGDRPRSTARRVGHAGSEAATPHRRDEDSGRAGEPTAGVVPACSNSRRRGRWCITSRLGRERPVIGIGELPEASGTPGTGPLGVPTQRRSETGWTTGGRHDAGVVKQSTTRPVACGSTATSRLVSRRGRTQGRSRWKEAETPGPIRIWCQNKGRFSSGGRRADLAPGKSSPASAGRQTESGERAGGPSRQRVDVSSFPGRWSISPAAGDALIVRHPNQRKIGADTVSQREYNLGMDVEQLRQDVREGRVKPDRLVELLITQQQKLVEAYARIRDLEEALEELRKQSSPTAKLAEPFSLKAEEKRQAARGRKSKKKKTQPRRRGRLRTADKLALAKQHEDVFPEGVDRDQCQFSHSRPVWRLIDGQAVLVAYHVYRGPRNEYGKIPGTLGRSEFGLEIIVAISYLVYLVGLSFDKVCLVMNFFQNLPLRKSQVDALLHQLARHWQREFDHLCTLLANSAVVHADETSWSIHSVWAFLSEKVRVFFFGVHKDGETLKQILDPATFAGLMISDDAAVYANFSHAQKCWAHLLRKAIKLTLQCPDNAEYRRLADELLDIYRRACRVQSDGRLSDAGRARKVAVLNDEILDLCGSVWFAELPLLEGPEDDYRLLCNELTRLLLAEQLFTFVTAAPVETPRGETRPVPGTNNVAEQALRNPAMARDMGRTNKTVPGARRQTVLSSVLESLRQYLPRFTLSSVVQEVQRWSTSGRSCFAELLEKLNLSSPDKSLLDTLLPIPAD